MGHWDEPRAAQPRAPRIVLACAPTDHQFADTLTRDLRLRGAAIEADPDSADANADAEPRLTQMADAPDWLIVVLSPAALWSPGIEQEMRAARDSLRRQRLRGVLTVVAVPCPPADIPPHWPITGSFDATRDYPAALRHLCAAVGIAEGIAEREAASQPVATTPIATTPIATTPIPAPISAPPDVTQQATAILASATDPAQVETAPIPAMARSHSPQTPQATPTMPTTQGSEAQRGEAGLAIAAHLPAGADASVHSDDLGPTTPATRPQRITRRSLLGVGATVAAVALAGATFQVWRTAPQPRAARSGPTVRWRYLINSHGVTAAVEGHGVIYVGVADGHFFALDAATHALRWAYDTKGALRPNDPVIEAGAVFCCATDGAVLKLSDDPGATGEAKRLLWRFPVPRQTVLTPTLGDGVLYVSCQRSRLFAVNSRTGATIWTDSTPFHPTSPATLDGSQLYVAGIDGVYALNSSNHATIWKTPVTGPINQQMLLSKGILYACARMGRALAFDAATGALRWSFSTDGLLFTPPVLDENHGTAFIGDDSGYVYALDANRGTLRWRQQLDNAAFSLRLFRGSVHVVSLGGYLYAFDPVVGAIRWQYVVGQGAVSPLGVGEDALYVSSADGYLYALNVPD